MVRVLNRWLVFAVLACALTAQAADEPAAGETADATHGAELFDLNCSACHSVAPALRNKLGPSLFGVVGRKAGTVEGYGYSPAMAADGRVWTVETLAAYVADPPAAVPNNRMKFDAGGLKPADRADIIAFLAEQK